MLWDDGVVTGRRAALAWGVVWLVVVVVATVLVWSVISRAGRGVVSASGPGVTSATSASSPDPSSPSSPSGSSAGSSPSSSPTRSTPAPSSPTGTADGSATPAPGPEPQRRTWEGAAGRVDVVCTASAASLAGVVAWTGYGVEVEDRGPDRVEVEFEGSDSDQRARVRATCAQGAPVFEIDD